MTDPEQPEIPQSVQPGETLESPEQHVEIPEDETSRVLSEEHVPHEQVVNDQNQKQRKLTRREKLKKFLFEPSPGSNKLY